MCPLHFESGREPTTLLVHFFCLFLIGPYHYTSFDGFLMMLVSVGYLVLRGGEAGSGDDGGTAAAIFIRTAQQRINVCFLSCMV